MCEWLIMKHEPGLKPEQQAGSARRESKDARQA